MTEPKHETPTEEQVAARKSKSQNPHHPHLGVGHLALLASTALLSQCAMSKPQAKQKIVESCMKIFRLLKMAERFESARLGCGQYPSRRRLLQMYVGAAFGQIERKQISSFGKLGAQEQLDLLGGANAFETRDKQCVADLKAD